MRRDPTTVAEAEPELPASPSAVAPGSSEPIRVFYDGDCGLCHASVRFLLRRDIPGVLRFAPIGGETFTGLLSAAELSARSDSVVVRTTDGRLLERSDAAVFLLGQLGGIWPTLGRWLRLVPRPLRNLGYTAVAACRRLLWKRPQGWCPLVPLHLQGRFDP